jgi:uncharacterized protein YjbI with pentapeptide repeats
VALSSDLISQFVKLTNDDNKKQTETTVYGTVKISDGKTYVQIDGSTMLTPISTTADTNDGDRVMVLVKNHSAVVTGNLSSPSATKDNVDKVEKDLGDRLDEFDIIVADKVNTKQLEAVQADIKTLTAKDLEVREKITAAEADIDKLETDNVTITDQLTAYSGKFDTIDTKFVTVSGQIGAANAKIETLEATDADFRNLEADYGDFKTATVDDLTAVKANISNLETEKLDVETADITYATISKLNTTNANISKLESDYGEFKTTTANNLEAVNANIDDLEAKKLSATDADLKYANIDFGNITEAAIKKVFSDSGIIKDLVVSEGHITGELVGVTIKGDIIEGGTVKADKLVVLGENGLYYKLNVTSLGETTAKSDPKYQNGLDGSVIIAKSITAEKITVDDLVAFGATIGGFHMGNHSLYSGVKSSATNTTRGVFLGDDGQIAFGDSNNFIKYYKDTDGKYKLAISAESLIFSASNKSVQDTIDEVKSSSYEATKTEVTTAINKIEVGGRNLYLGSKDFSGNLWDMYNMNQWSIESEKYKDFTVISKSTAWGGVYQRITAKKGEMYAISFFAKGTSGSRLVSVHRNIALGNVTTGLELINGNFETKDAWWSKSSDATDWKRYWATLEVVADDVTLGWRIENGESNSTVYICGIKLERGNKPTDWTPAPEDIDDNINDTAENVITTLSKTITDHVTAIQTNADSISASVEKLQTTVNDDMNGLREDINTVREKVELQLTEDEVNIQIDKKLQNGVTKVETSTGFKFDENGLNISKSGSSTNTQIDETGMAVNNTETGEKMLTADKNGVEARNLRAETYLIIGGRSRFENYGTNRTGCFWIGE